MKLNLGVCLILILLSAACYAQKQKPALNSITTGGIIIGQNGSYGLFQTINGVGWPKWFTGGGVGYDHHYYKSIPVFLDARRYLGKQENGFLYADIGYNFPVQNKPGREVGHYTSYHFSGGVYSDIGAGYGILFSRKKSLLLSGGYSFKNIRDRIGEVSPCLVAPCPENVSRYKYDFNRIVLKAGIQFR